MRFAIIALSLLLLATSCGEKGGDTPTGTSTDTSKLATQLERKPFYERNPMSTAPSHEVRSEKLRLSHTGWGDSYGTFTLNFPEGESKRVILQYTMGCFGTRPSDYDNTTIFFVKDKASEEWHEIARAFTPFGGLFDSAWEKSFYLDVTEFQSLLQGDTEFRYFYDGWDAREDMAHAVTLNFIHYKGEPERKVIAIKNIYDSATSDNSGNKAWVYGIPGYDIEAAERLGMRTITLPKETRDIELRLSITGHGHDKGIFPDIEGYEPQNAAEFVENYYDIVIDGYPQAERGHIFYSNANNYLQQGTYSYDRANWAPGNPANVHYWSIVPSRDMDNELSIDINLPRFISEFNTPNASEGVARYVIQADLFIYK